MVSRVHVIAADRNLDVYVSGRKAFVIIADHKLHLTGEVGLRAALELDDLHKVNRLLIIANIMFPGVLEFLAELAILFHRPVERKKRAFGKRKGRGDWTLA